MSNLTKESMQFIIGRLLERAKESVEESNSNPENEFQSGRRIAYYEMLDIIKSELDVRDQDLDEFGLDIDLIALLVSKRI